MPHEEENLEQQEHRPHPHPHPEGPEKHDCGCGKNCPCRHGKHLGAKLVAALLIFLAGFGSAMLCKCMSHPSGCMYHKAMKGKHFGAKMTDGAGNTIIINTDGSCAMKTIRPLMQQGMVKQPQQKTPAMPQQQMQMPMQNMETMPIDEDEE